MELHPQSAVFATHAATLISPAKTPPFDAFLLRKGRYSPRRPLLFASTLKLPGAVLAVPGGVSGVRALFGSLNKGGVGLALRPGGGEVADLQLLHFSACHRMQHCVVAEGPGLLQVGGVWVGGWVGGWGVLGVARVAALHALHARMPRPAPDPSRLRCPSQDIVVRGNFIVGCLDSGWVFQGAEPTRLERVQAVIQAIDPDHPHIRSHKCTLLRNEAEGEGVAGRVCVCVGGGA